MAMRHLVAKVPKEDPSSDRLDKHAMPKPSKVVMNQRAGKTQFKRNATAAGLMLIGGVISFASLIGLYATSRNLGVTETLRLQGRLQAIEQSTPVQHETGGTVKNIFVTEGEIVREGQILLSLGTDDLEENHKQARRELSRLLVRSLCLTALKDGQDVLEIPRKLEIAAARLKETHYMRRAARECQVELERHQFEKSVASTVLSGLRDKVEIHKRLVAATEEMRVRSSKLNPADVGQMTEVQDLLKVDRKIDALNHALSAATAQQAVDKEIRDQRQTKMDREANINRQLDLLHDKLIKAEEDMARMENLMQQRFVFASTSGRIQRLRVQEVGKRIAAKAYILEIAPLTTDFEILSTANLVEIPDLKVGAGVQVQLSGGLSKPIWVPALVDEITKVSENKRVVRVKLLREDLNKRDLLFGDHSLNGLGEQSEALISVKSETALKALGTILERQFFNGQAQEI